MATLVDYKQRELKVGQKVKVVENIPSVDGMLYENTIVRLVNTMKLKKL